MRAYVARMTYEAGEAGLEGGRTIMAILIIILILVFGAGGGYYGHTRWGPSGGAGIGLGTILLILLIAYMLGLIH